MVKNTYYKQKCCVVFPSSKTDLFYMNMKVYRIEKADRMGVVPEADSKLIWCAVYQPDQEVS